MRNESSMSGAGIVGEFSGKLADPAVATKSDMKPVSELESVLNYIIELTHDNYEAYSSIADKLAPVRLKSPDVLGTGDGVYFEIYDTPVGSILRDIVEKLQYNNSKINDLKYEVKV